MAYSWRLSVFLILAFSGLVNATTLAPKNSYYPAKFYQDYESGIKDFSLKNTIFEILSKAHQKSDSHDQLVERCNSHSRACYQHVSLGYTRAREILFGKIHLQRSSRGYEIFDVYCEKLWGEKDFKRDPPGPGKIPDHNYLNAEHTWPQSHFSHQFDRDMQKSDLSNLYPVYAPANSERGNFAFSNVSAVLKQICSNAKLGYSSNGNKQMFYEVPRAHKGNVARAIFYFSVRYKMSVGSIEEASLRAWNREDSVDDFERERNEAIFAVQRSRNPFIDHPELIEAISDF